MTGTVDAVQQPSFRAFLNRRRSSGRRHKVQQHGIEMPITECIYKVIHGEMDARYAVPYLMERGMKNEMNIF